MRQSAKKQNRLKNHHHFVLDAFCACFIAKNRHQRPDIEGENVKNRKGMAKHLRRFEMRGSPLA